LRPDERPGFDWQAVEVLWHQPSHSVAAAFHVDLHQTLYFPAMLFVALVVAGRVSLGSRYFSAGLELLGITALLARASLRYVLLDRWTNGLPHEAAVDAFLQTIQLSVAAPRGMAVAFPLILWFALSRRAIIAAKGRERR
jgi:hypothetical protein